MLQLWWGITEQTYLYYWHHNVWAVLAAWALFFVLMGLIGEELWRAGYRSAIRATSEAQAAPRPLPPPVPHKNSDGMPTATKRRFLAPPSEAFPGIRGFISSHRRGSDLGQ